MLFLGLVLGCVSANYLLVQRENIVFNLNEFNAEHGIESVAAIDNLDVFKVSTVNYEKYSNTINSVYEVEAEREYSIDFSEFNPNNRDFFYIQEPGNDDFRIVNKIPWHLDRITKRNLPFDNTFPFSESGSCHTNKEIDIETVVVDTGCDQTHSEFEGRAEFLKNFAGDNVNTDSNNHGTHCSGLIGSKSYGVCRDAKIKCIKVLDGSGRGTTSGVIAGMEFAFKRHLKRERKNKNARTIMSMSLGGGKSNVMNRVVEKMIETSDTFYIVVASGNEDRDIDFSSPASSNGVFSVMASDKYDNRAYFSNYGNASIYSPGVDIESTIPDEGRAVYSGTSFSTPILAGIMNHYIDRFPEMNMKKLKERILEDATKDLIEGNPENTPNLFVFLDV